MRKYELNENFFNVIDTEEKAYWLGFLYADGCVFDSTLIIQLNKKDIEHLNKLKEALNYGGVIENENDTYPRLRIHSKKLTDDLKRLGCIPKKSLILTFPNEDIIPHELLKHFMRGYFDGDGTLSLSIGKRKRNELKNPREDGYDTKIWFFKIIGTHEFLTSYAEILGQGMNKLHQHKKDVNNYNLKYGGTIKVRKIMDFLYDEATVFLDRKHEKYNELISFHNAN